MRYFVLLAALVASFPPSPAFTAQTFPRRVTLERQYPEVRDGDGRLLPLAWAGGLNAPQPAKLDIDGDGLEDLYVFDRATDRQFTYRGLGGTRYEEAPELLAAFPPVLRSWVLVHDYDGDGLPDLFTYAEAVDGIEYYRALRDGNGRLSFERQFDGDRPALLATANRPIFVSNIDYPAIVDVDFDGDTDVLTFNVVGGYLEFYRNVQVEDNLPAGTLRFVLEDECWGNFYESGLSTELTLSDDPAECAGPGDVGDNLDFRHSGSTVLALDYSGNGLMDIMLGDISFRRMVLGFNTGSRTDAYITSQDDDWPRNGVTLDLPSFPAMYHIDFDGDGVRDLMAGPHQTSAEDVNSLWWYRNRGTEAAPDFVFRDSQALIRDMIDVGTAAQPVFFDYNADGLTDLLVANEEDYTEAILKNSYLRVYENVGTVTAPSFRLAETDYLNLTRFANTGWAFAPAFGDLTGDGRPDVVIGDNQGRLYFAADRAATGAPDFANPTYGWMDIDVGLLAKPAIADLDRDGLNDLLVGGFDGRIRFFRNVGTPTEPRFDPATDAPGNLLQLGGIDTRSGESTGHPVPRVLQYGDETVVLTGNRAGRLEAYRFFGTDYRRDFEPLTDTLGGLDVGDFSAAALADLNGNGRLELVVGNELGGVEFFATDVVAEATVSSVDLREGPSFSIYPNPVGERLYVDFGAGPQGRGITILDIAGRLLSVPVSGREVDVSQLASGIYFLRVEDARGRSAVRRFVKP